MQGKRCCPDEDSGFAGFSRYPASGKTGGERKTAEKHAESRHGEKAVTETKVSLETQVIEPVKVHLGMDKPGNGKQDTDKPETDLSKKHPKRL